ncbi:MAG: hypothetical protein ACOC04_03995, partial [Halothece sp.]
LVATETVALRKIIGITIALVMGILFFIMVFTGLLIFVIPGIYLWIIFAFLTEAIALRNCNFDAFNYSRNLVKGQFWKIFGRLLLLVISSGILILFFLIPMSFISVVLEGAPIIQGGLEVILNLITAAITYFIYHYFYRLLSEFRLSQEWVIAFLI